METVGSRASSTGSGDIITADVPDGSLEMGT